MLFQWLVSEEFPNILTDAHGCREEMPFGDCSVECIVGAETYIPCPLVQRDPGRTEGHPRKGLLGRGRATLDSPLPSSPVRFTEGSQ